MSHIFPRNCHEPLPTAATGEGCYLFDSTGKRYLDGSGGAAVSCLGHSDSEVIAAIQEQVGKLAFAHTGFMQSEPHESLADLIVSHAPGNLDRAYIVSGGSEATEAAIKLARQFHVERGEPGRRHLIARRQSYHGNTLGALAAGGNLRRRETYSPLLMEVTHISPCYEYAFREDGETAYDYGRRAAQELEDAILRLGPDKVMAFIAEPVVGATAGAVPAVDRYLRRIREICDRFGVLLILDEVMCGMGRTGHLFACDADDVAPDILCIAKGLGAGYQPVGAMLCTKEIYDTISEGSGSFQHGHTYQGHPIAAAAGLAVVNAMLTRNLIPRVREIGERLRSALNQRFGQHPHVGDIRGRGLLLGLELVSDRTTKAPFDPSRRVASKIRRAALEEGLVCYPMQGTRDGRNGDHVLLAPPFILSEEQIDELVGKLSTAIRIALAN